MKEIALVIMAAGIGSRYGAGIKQLQKVGPQGEIIIDYNRIKLRSLYGCSQPLLADGDFFDCIGRDTYCSL